MTHLVGSHSVSLAIGDAAEYSLDALYLAAQRGDTVVVSACLAAGIHVTGRYCGGQQQTPLHAAAAVGEAAVIGLLLEHDAGTELVCARDVQGQTPLHLAAAANEVSAVGALLSLSALSLKSVMLTARNRWGETPLHVAAAAGAEKAARLLLDAGAPADAVDEWGRTPAL
eukprot:UC1_evm1s225